jgi:hypothetical protein
MTLEELKEKIYGPLITNPSLIARRKLRSQGKDPKLDLLQHYYGSKNLAKISPVASLGVGLGKEMLNYFNQPSGFSVDDMGANLMGIMGVPLDVASSLNIFNHTEEKGNIKGYGQGDFRKVAQKFNPFDALASIQNKNNFTKDTIDVEDYSTKVARIQAKKEAEARARAQAEAQARAQAEAKAQQAISQRQQQQSQKQKQSQLPAMNTPRNITKFGPVRSTTIAGGRGGRGNVAARKKSASAPVFKSYGPPNMQRF